ncbi:hypothetical protein ANTQUA_LOCUS9185 [Anthophora quadrimaculata]
MLKDFSFLLKVHELIIAGVCLHELTKYNEYSIPRWLWIIYCIDASTYSIIYFCFALAHIFEKPRILLEFTYFSLGAIFHLIGGIAGITRARYESPDDSKVPRSELKIGLLLMGNFIILFCEAAHIAYTEYPKLKQPDNTRHSTVD